MGKPLLGVGWVQVLNRMQWPQVLGSLIVGLNLLFDGGGQTMIYRLQRMMNGCLKKY